MAFRCALAMAALSLDLAAGVLLHDPEKVSASGPDFTVHFWIDQHVPRAKATANAFINGTRGRCLQFLHIPKTAGQSIEVQGSQSNTHWGRLDKRLGCSHQTAGPAGPECALPGGRCSMWHVPPALDPVLAKSYEHCETFCVVRHPVARFESQHQWWTHRCNSSDMLTFAQRSLKEAETRPYIQDCHLVPQAVYVGKGRRWCQHVLKFETLLHDFRNLMSRFGINADMTVHENHGKCNADLPNEGRALVEKFYAADYDAFGYSRR